MATEFRLNYTGSEINQKLEAVDGLASSLENNYYTSIDIDTKLDLKADLVDGKVPLEQLPDDIGRGITSWNDLTDKPFEEESWSITWDGTPTDDFVEVVNGLGYYKVSEAIPTKDELVGTTYKGANMEGGSTEFVIESNDIVDYNTCCYGEKEGVFLVVTQETYVELGDFEFKLTEGTWFIGFGIPTSLSKSVIKKLDKKYLPDDIGSGVSSWNDLEDKPFYDNSVAIQISEAGEIITSQPLEALGGMEFTFIKASNDYFSSPEESYGSLIELDYNGEHLSFTIDESHIVDLGNGFGILIMENGFFPLMMNVTSVGTSVFPAADMLGEDMTFDVQSTGIYFMNIEGMGKTTSLTKFNIKQIDAKFIPANLDFDLSNYYTKSEIDSILGDCSAVLDEISVVIGE